MSLNHGVPSRRRKINALDLVPPQAQPQQPVNLSQTRQVADLVVVGLELPQVAQARELMDRINLVVADVDALEILKVAERREAADLVGGDKERSDGRRHACQEGDLVLVTVEGVSQA
jgi:hypothetical protein